MSLESFRLLALAAAEAWNVQKEEKKKVMIHSYFLSI